ncbi:hypothetical protein F5B19DRAFT_495232 [Rostrohypoxylon terebratum]|nr:hypothetical protein F5B19DRAFT_495232 [Rostrohypoxylon terebratum]
MAQATLVAARVFCFKVVYLPTSLPAIRNVDKELIQSRDLHRLWPRPVWFLIPKYRRYNAWTLHKTEEERRKKKLEHLPGLEQLLVRHELHTCSAVTPSGPAFMRPLAHKIDHIPLLVRSDGDERTDSGLMENTKPRQLLSGSSEPAECKTCAPARDSQGRKGILANIDPGMEYYD